jgi:amidase
MSENRRTRREVLRGIAAAPVLESVLLAETAAPSICFMGTKKLSAREALAAHLKQIERVNPKVNAIVTLVPELAAQAAARADEMQAHKEALGPLHGVPVAH